MLPMLVLPVHVLTPVVHTIHRFAANPGTVASIGTSSLRFSNPRWDEGQVRFLSESHDGKNKDTSNLSKYYVWTL